MKSNRNRMREYDTDWISWLTANRRGDPGEQENKQFAQGSLAILIPNELDEKLNETPDGWISTGRPAGQDTDAQLGTERGDTWIWIEWRSAGAGRAAEGVRRRRICAPGEEAPRWSLEQSGERK